MPSMIRPGVLMRLLPVSWRNMGDIDHRPGVVHIALDGDGDHGGAVEDIEPATQAKADGAHCFIGEREERDVGDEVDLPADEIDGAAGLDAELAEGEAEAVVGGDAVDDAYDEGLDLAADRSGVSTADGLEQRTQDGVGGEARNAEIDADHTVEFGKVLVKRDAEVGGLDHGGFIGGGLLHGGDEGKTSAEGFHELGADHEEADLGGSVLHELSPTHLAFDPRGGAGACEVGFERAAGTGACL